MKPSVPLVSLLALVAGTGLVRADTYTFVPTSYAEKLSRSLEPVLRIKSGDRVVTTTVDDVGVDSSGQRVAPGPNPQTGPFYIEGAAPGDLLVISIEKLEPNRATGYSTSRLAAGALESGALDGKPDDTRFPWTIDAAKGVVRFDLSALGRFPDWSSRLASPRFELPLSPTLGSIGVAPPGEGAGTTTAGPFGGALLTAALTAGTRVMLPVFQPGALLFLGHGHARQGDGVVSTTGVETSMNVEFSVEVVKKKPWPHSTIMRPSTVVGEFAQGWPRLETADCLMTVGSAATLPQALQRATLELHHWLDDDYGLNEKSVSLFIGQTVEYEVGAIGDQQATVVAKMRKSYLPRPAGPFEAPPEQPPAPGLTHPDDH